MSLVGYAIVALIVALIHITGYEQGRARERRDRR